jgi:hypothetical protein
MSSTLTLLLRENLKFEKQIQLPIPSRSNVFGVPLEELMGHDGEKGGVPRVVKDCIIYLRETGMSFLLPSLLHYSYYFHRSRGRGALP